MQLTSKLTHAAPTQTKLRGRIAWSITKAEVSGDFPCLRLECLEPRSKVDSYSSYLGWAGVLIFHQNLVPRIRLGIVTVESFEDEILSLLTIIT